MPNEKQPPSVKQFCVRLGPQGQRHIRCAQCPEDRFEPCVPESSAPWHGIGQGPAPQAKPKPKPKPKQKAR